MRTSGSRDRQSEQRGSNRRNLLLASALVGVALAVGVLAWRVRPHSSPGGVTGAKVQRDLPRPQRSRRAVVRSSPAARALGLPPVPRGPVPGYVLIADRNNGRLLIVSPTKRVVWRFPRPGDVRPGQSFHDPDDAFFTPGYRAISTNEEFNQQMALVSFRSHRIVWSYGRAGVRGSGHDELSNPDDAYQLRNGEMMVADIGNCRVLRVARSGRIVGQIGSAGHCVHDPPRALSSPNGATPLAGGGVLVTEIGGYVDRIDARGRLMWSIRTPTTYPSDAQLLPSGNVLVAGFNTPGRVDILRPNGRIVWTYGPSSGRGALDRPSLAVRWPNGMIAITDDWHHRVVVVDPQTKRIVWQYGHLGIASAAPGYLSKPDGLDLLPASFARPATHHVTSPPHLCVTRVGTLPEAMSRVAAVGLPGGRVMALGGLVAGSSSDQVLVGPPGDVRTVGRLPVPTHDAAAAPFDGGMALFGGGEAASTDTIVRVDPTTGAARVAAHLDEPLSDLGAVDVGGKAYLVGGYTGSRFASAVLRVGRYGRTTTIARLPSGLRYAGVAALDGRIYVAGGLTPRGESAAVYVVDPRAGRVRRIGRLPTPVAHAPLVAVGQQLYLVGGRGSAGRASARVFRVDPRSGMVQVAGSLPSALADAAAVSLPGRAIVLGGGTDAVFAIRTGRPPTC